MTIDIDEIEALARVAIRGPWVFQYGDVRTRDSMYRANKDGTPTRSGYNGCPIIICRSTPAAKRDRANFAFIAAVNPAVMLELVAELRQLRASRA